MKNLKVSSLFHWLYGAVMFLPILLLPVFMIYSHRHTIDSGTLDVPQNLVVDFNQISSINEFEYTQNSYSTVTLISDYEFKIDDIFLIEFTQSYTYTSVSRNLPLFDINGSYTSIRNVSTFLEGNADLYATDDSNLSSGNYYARFKMTSDVNNDLFYWVTGGDLDVNYYHINVFNLTQMFGSGNEPTYSQFISYYPLDNYSFTLSHKELLKNTSTITYSDTDIMSQATYQLYNATDKYFNISQFFGLENLWDYMVLNWFGGNVTIYLRIFWQFLTYWLVVSIAWLIFDLFMYVPKLAHRWLDRSAIE